MRIVPHREQTHFGGKAGAGVVQQLINRVPPHDMLIVPFAGHCALSRTIAPCHRLRLCDLDPEVSNWWADRVPNHGTFEQRDGLELLEVIAGLEDLDAGSGGGVLAVDPRRVVIYCDPPYRLSTRTSDCRYRCDWTDAEHSRLLEVATRLSATGYRMMISHYRNELYDGLLTGWNRHDFTGHSRGGPRVESLYCSFAVDDLHDFRFYTGTSSRQTSPRRQREVMKRREQSARRKVLAMAPLERKRFLRSLVAEFGDGK